MHKNIPKKKVMIIGIDGMDPDITEKMMNEGKLPNFASLKATGAYAHLATTVPSESAVAWTSFSTGMNPGNHGIFDFIMRDPRTYSLYLSLSEISNTGGKTEVKIRRKGEAFWDILSKNKVNSFIYFCPDTFPAQPLSGKMLSGMGVPDLYGTIGRLSFYTSGPLTAEDKDSRGKIVHVEPQDNIIETEIYGPKLSSGSSIKETAIPLKVILKPDDERIEIYLQNNRFLLKKGAWSSWQRVTFKTGLFRKASGILRLYLKSVSPDFELYCSPINFDPERPLFAISFPKDFSAKLARRTGLFYTQGMPNDTWALTENRLDEKAFLEQVDEVLDERKKILREELKNFKGGAFFFYFDTLDAIQHMFWRYLDPQHPLYKKDPLYQDTIFRYYEKIDGIIGNVLKGMDKDATLIILSDHGFGPFRKSVHLNRWLIENGYLCLKPGLEESGESFEGIDWPKTKAYALGFGGIYLNRIGREYYGILEESEAQSIKQAIAERLKEFKDPQSGKNIVNNVYFSEDVFKGPYINDAPDLFVGFDRGFRASWQTALGGAPNILLEDNRKKWSGDHLSDSSLVPGVIFVNRRVELNNPAIIDIAPSILALFDIAKPKAMLGNTLIYKDKK